VPGTQSNNMSIPTITIQKTNTGIIGSTFPLSGPQIKQILNIALDGSSKQGTPLGGRSAIVKMKIKHIGPVVIKPYIRGGWAQLLLNDRFLNIGGCRAKKEFEMLLKIKDIGIHVPEPVMYFQKGRMFYRCWLMTKEISNQGTIAHISLTDTSLVASLLSMLWQGVDTMVENGIFHVDFHPGNVILDNDEQLCFLDFDKAVSTSMGKKALLKKYINRWNRAVLKHGLSNKLLKC
jgi:tRNA A-37 threonylcarbamoyl transferase component Bud32